MRVPESPVMAAVVLLAACVVAVFSTPSGLAGQAADEYDRFQLYTACARLGVSVVVQDEEDLAGLTEASVRTAVVSRLRSARIYKGDDAIAMPHLYVFVYGAGNAFRVAVSLRKAFFDYYSGNSFHAMAWESGGIGIHRRNSQRVRGIVAEHMDKFIDEYLRVNETACSR